MSLGRLLVTRYLVQCAFLSRPSLVLYISILEVICIMTPMSRVLYHI